MRYNVIRSNTFFWDVKIFSFYWYFGFFFWTGTTLGCRKNYRVLEIVISGPFQAVFKHEPYCSFGLIINYFISYIGDVDVWWPKVYCVNGGLRFSSDMGLQYTKQHTLGNSRPRPTLRPYIVIPIWRVGRHRKANTCHHCPPAFRTFQPRLFHRFFLLLLSFSLPLLHRSVYAYQNQVVSVLVHPSVCLSTRPELVSYSEIRCFWEWGRQQQQQPEFGILCTRPSAFPEVAGETSDVSQC